jgi:hypothetical protein
MAGMGSKPEVLFNNHTSAFTSSGHATALAQVRVVPTAALATSGVEDLNSVVEAISDYLPD